MTLVVLTACGGQPKDDPEPTPASPAPTPVSKAPGLISFVGGDNRAFPDTIISETSTVIVSLRNIGELEVTAISNSALGSGFSFTGGAFPGTGGNCGTDLAPDSSCSLEIDFTPGVLGANAIDLDISYSTDSNNNTVRLSLSGNGIVPPAPNVLGISNLVGVTNNAEFNWSCERTCEFRYLINQTASHTFTTEPYGASTSANHNTGNGVYYLHVQANDTVFSLESSVVSVSFTMDTVVPGPPTILNFDLDATETSTSTLHWTIGSDDVAVSHYQLAVGTTSGGIDIIDFTDVADGVSGKLNGLTIVDGIDYFTTIRTVDTAGNVSSEVTSDAWRVPGPPEAINSLASTSALKNEVTIGWSAPYHNGSAIVDYLVEYRAKVPADQPWILLADGVGTDTTAQISGLTPSTQYEFKVRAYNGSTSPDSNVLTVETAPDDPFFEPNVYQAMNLGGATKSIAVAYEDATEFYLDDVLVSTKNAGETYEFDSTLGSVLRADKPFFVSGRLTQGTPGNTNVRSNGNIVWNSPDWAGKEFIFTGTRDPNHIITVYAFEDSSITIHQGATEVGNETLLKGEFHTFSLSTNGGFHMQSDGLIMAYMYSNAGGTYVTDPKPLLPASNDIIGFASTRAKIATATDGNSLTLHHSDSHTQNSTANAGTDVNINSRGDKNLYRGESLRIIGTDVIVANSNADSNGYCSAPFVPTSMLKKKYILNVVGDFVAFASLEEGQITMEEPDGTITLIDLERAGLNPYAPLKARVSNIPAGTKFYSDVRFQAWYQPLGWTDSASDDDETVMFGFD